MFGRTRILVIVALMWLPAWIGVEQEKARKPLLVDDGVKSDHLLRQGTSSGRLEESDPMLGGRTLHDTWSLPGAEGMAVVVTMRSVEVDSYLVVLDPLGRILDEDDDSGGGYDSRIEFTTDLDGPYQVLATTYERETGPYSIELELDGLRTVDLEGLDTNGDPAARYALVIGVADYPGTRSDLPVVAADVDVIVDLLTQRFLFDRDNILVLRDEQATRENILNAALVHLGQAGAGGTALLYYSGHGTQRAQSGLDDALDPEPDGMDEALAVYDGIILDDEIGFVADRLGADNVLFVFDSCYSGTASRGGQSELGEKFVSFDELGDAGAPKEFLAEKSTRGAAGVHDMLRNPQRHVLLAGGAEDQVTFAPESIGVSSFTFFLSEVLWEMDDSSSFAEVMAEVRARASDWATGNGREQDPQAEGARIAESVGSFLAR